MQSEYEKIRVNNIIRNNARLRELGLISAHEEERSNAAAKGEECPHDEKTNPTERPSSRKRTLPSSSPVIQRKSPRFQINASEDETKQAVVPMESIVEEREQRVKECREARLRLANSIFESGDFAKAKAENPTATYEHCLMRVQSMTHNGLANRVKAIERAAGRHCVVKMAIFKSCLQDEGLWDLADLAGEALERLKALQPPLE